MTPVEPAPVLALVRLKEGRTYHAHGQVWRGDRATEIRDPEFLVRIRGDGLLAVTVTEAGRRGQELRVESRSVVTERAGPCIAESVHGGPTAHAPDEITAHAPLDVTAQGGVPPTVHADHDGLNPMATAHGENVPEALPAAQAAHAGNHGPEPVVDQPTAQAEDASDDEAIEFGVPEKITAVLDACREPRTRIELQKLTGLHHRMHFQRTYLNPLLQVGLLAMTVPENPRASYQRYVTTPAGRLVLAKAKGEIQ